MKRTIKDWLTILILLLDDVAALVVVLLVLRLLGIKIPLAVTIVVALLLGGIVFVIHKAVIPVLHKKKITGSEEMIGRQGMVVKKLAPAGVIRIGGEYWKSKSVGEDIAVGEEVEDVRALTRNEYIQGMALPETLDDNYITGQILAQVEHIQAERSAPEWTQTFGAFAQRRLLLNFRKEKEEEAVEAKEKKEAAAKTSSGETALEDEFFAAQARVDELHAEGVHVEGGVQALADDMRRKRELKDLVRKGGVRGSKAA